MSETLLEVKNLCKYFSAGRNKTLKAVDNVSFHINKGETLGLVGESGCGKTTCGRTVSKLYHPTSGSVVFDGKNVESISGRELLHFKKDVQMIFQDPYSSLDPRMTIAEIIGEGMDVHFKLSNQEKNERISVLLNKVGLTEDYANRFAHELSGGQRQRVGIARALAVEPKFIICDEPISALDVSIQAQIINLLAQLQRELELTVLFISHDLRVVRHITHRVMVMYLGSNVEVGPTEAIFQHPAHPYTQVLTKAAPKLDPLNRQRDYAIEGEPPSPIHTPTGCKFHPRCPYCTDKCRSEVPELKEIAPGHLCACHYPL